MAKPKELTGKVVVVSGSSRGIGKETALAFAEHGCRLVISYHEKREEIGAIERECRERGADDVLAVHLDVTDSTSISKMVDQAVSQFGGIDILINNAGVVSWEHLRNQSEDEIRSQIETNLTGLILMTKAALPHLRDAVINLSSGAGKSGASGLSTYSATKFGVRGFTQALANEENKLRVFSVNPTVTATDMTNFRGQPAEEVAAVIVKVARGEYDVSSGGDIDVWEVS